MLRKTPISIQKAKDVSERAEAIDFVNQEYLEIFGTTPPESDCYFTAKRAQEIVGSIGLDFSNSKGQMPLATIYDFSEYDTPYPRAGHLGVQYGRWRTKVPGISASLVYVATCHALNIGKLYGWCEHTDAVHKVTEKLGIKFVPIRNAKLKLDCVAKENQVFYTTPPFMKCYMMYLPQIQQVLESRIAHLVTHQRLIVPIAA